jgi:hypothetical protein
LSKNTEQKTKNPATPDQKARPDNIAATMTLPATSFSTE